MTTFRFLKSDDFNALHDCFLEAFSDYSVNMQMSEAEFRERLVHNGVRLDLSVGAFEANEMTGFTLNGLGDWQGKLTAYDAGTGVVPHCRGRGIGKEMFGFMLPKLKEKGVRQYLLEVITTNEAAVNLYRKLVFEETRKLAVFKFDKQINHEPDANRIELQIREIQSPDWQLLKSFWDGQPSWQNSIESIERSVSEKLFLSAFLGKICVGYAVVFRTSGSILQLAVAKDYRRKSVGQALLAAIQNSVGVGKSLRITNVDFALENALAFCHANGFERVLNQYEMAKDL